MNLFREKVIDRIIEIRDALPRDPHDACSDDIADAVLELFAERLQEIADQYAASVFTMRQVDQAKAAGVVTDGIAGAAIRERMLAEVRSLKEA